MDVYHNGNFQSGRRGSRLTAVPVQQTFLWGRQEILVPAVYVGQAGAVLDVCARIPVEDMAAFLRKWPKERRLSLDTQEDYEQIDADNPGSRDFLVEMSLDDAPLKLSSSSSINWYPEEVFRMGNEASAPAQEDEWTNDLHAEKLMEAYGCSRECCWHFGRLNYNWNGEPILAPRKISLAFQAQPTPVTAGYFTTALDAAGRLLASLGQNQAASSLEESEDSAFEQPEASSLVAHEEPAFGETEELAFGQTERPAAPADSAGHLPPSNGSLEEQTIKIAHPGTGQEYTLTLHDCRQTRHDFTDIGAEGILYPEYCQMLSYHISPDIGCDLFDIRDCADSDKPRKSEGSEKPSDASGATAVFLAGKSPSPERRTAVSSMHFEPVPEIRWRMVFQVRTKPRMEVSFVI